MQNFFELILGWLSNIIFKKWSTWHHETYTTELTCETACAFCIPTGKPEPAPRHWQRSTGSPGPWPLCRWKMFWWGTGQWWDSGSSGLLPWLDRERDGERVVMHQLKYQWTKCLRSITSWLTLLHEPFKRCYDFKMTATRAALMHMSAKDRCDLFFTCLY